MKKKYSIYTIFGTLLILFIVFLTAVVLITSSMKHKEYQMIQESNKIQLDKESSALITLMGSSVSQVAWDYTYWDDLVLAVSTKDPKWFGSNISTIISSFRLDYVAVYDKNYSKVHDASSLEVNSIPVIPEEAFKLFTNAPLISFYIRTGDDLYRIYGATIHPTSDPSHTKTPAAGYLFISKKWDEELLNELSVLNGSAVKINFTDSAKVSINKNSIVSTYKLNSFDGTPSAWLEFTRQSTILERYRKSTFNIVLLLSASLLAMLASYMFAVMRWGINPLKSLILCIEHEDIEGFKDLKSASTEYSKVGELLAEHFKQKDELIAARKMAEESDRLKSAFLANVSHEIRTPMNGIMGFAGLLSEPGVSEEERREYLNIIEESGRRMLSIINDLIDISIIDAGQIKIIPAHFKINELLNHIYEFFRYEIEARGISFACEKGLDDSAVIYTDRDKLYAILINLLKNASKYTHTGSIRFGYSHNDNFLTFFVSDTGIGISESRHSAVFERFIQADDSISKHYEGTGLGLSISKAYVEALGGKIWLESSVGKGSDFYFKIPL